MTIAYRAARLLTDSKAEIIEDGVVIVEGETITGVGPWSDLGDSLEDTEVKDLGDVTLLPGLFDCHVNTALVILSSYEHKLIMPSTGPSSTRSYGDEYNQRL
jgi:imidazolonepropionase-like amidohydrolase